MSALLDGMAIWAGAMVLLALFGAVFAGPIFYGLWRGRRAPMLAGLPLRQYFVTWIAASALGMVLVALFIGGVVQAVAALVVLSAVALVVLIGHLLLRNHH